MQSTSVSRSVIAVFAFAISSTQAAPPEENRYDVLGKFFRPFMGVLLDDRSAENRAMFMRMRMTEVTGRLPQEFKGSTLQAAVQFPDKLKLIAPVPGGVVTVCRNGSEVWAAPGSLMEAMLKVYDGQLPKMQEGVETPLFLPITPLQAAFLPALFQMDEELVIEDVNGVPCRVLAGGLMPDLAKSTESEDFKARVWIADGYVPKKIEVVRKDFSVVVEIEELRFGPSLNAAVWNPAEGDTDVYRTQAKALEQLLYVVMNSLRSDP